MVTKELNKECNCELKPVHVVGEHDWCCQICGGSHVERICPYKKESGGEEATQTEPFYKEK